MVKIFLNDGQTLVLKKLGTPPDQIDFVRKLNADGIFTKKIKIGDSILGLNDVCGCQYYEDESDEIDYRGTKIKKERIMEIGKSLGFSEHVVTEAIKIMEKEGK